MKPLTLIALLLVLLLPAYPEAAETDATAIESLVVDIWPDYDKASVLVLMTGTLPGGSPLPARVTLPIPESASIHAVARIDSRDGVMKDDILSSPGLGELTLITPDPAFRVEYYQPYIVTGKQRAFDFAWQAALSVASFKLKVQQPAAAAAFRTVPATTEIVRGNNGLNYFTYPAQSLPAGQRFDLHVEYTMDLPQLSVQNQVAPNQPAQNQPAQNRQARNQPAPEPGPAPPGQPVGPRVRPGANWPYLVIIAGGVLMILAVIWMVANRRAGASQKPRR